MSCVFPTPKEIPYQVKQNVMNHVFPKKGSLIKRGFLIRIYSGYALFLWIIVLFSLLYIQKSSRLIYPVSSPTDNNIVSSSIITKQEPLLYTSIENQDLDTIEIALLETEALLIELETLI